MSDTLRKLTSEPALIILILVSLLFFKTTFEKEAGTEIVAIYLIMAVVALAIFILKKLDVITTEVNPKSGNSVESLLWAVGAIVGFTALYSVVNLMFRQSILPVQSSGLGQTAFQSFFGALVRFSSVDFSQLTPIKYYLFGYIIPITETITLIGLMIFLVWMLNTPLNLKNPRVHAVITILAVLFMFFHLKVRGVNNNIDLAMTFLFGYITLVLAVKLKEYEAANGFHIGTNLLSLIYGR